MQFQSIIGHQVLGFGGEHRFDQITRTEKNKKQNKQPPRF